MRHENLYLPMLDVLLKAGTDPRQSHKQSVDKIRAFHAS
jgi:hypothetical protein